MRVTSAEFAKLPSEPATPFVLSVVITGSGFNDRSVPLVASFGDVPVRVLRTNVEGTSASGLLTKVPAEGAVLRVGFLNSRELQETAVQFHEPA